MLFRGLGTHRGVRPALPDCIPVVGDSNPLLVAVPVLLGSLARIPMGMLTDRFGGRALFTILMLLMVVPALLVPRASSYRDLLWVGLLLRMAGSSFAIV